MVQELSDPRRVDPPFVAVERTMLEAWLDYHRVTLLVKCEGLARHNGHADVIRELIDGAVGD